MGKEGAEMDPIILTGWAPGCKNRWKDEFLLRQWGRIPKEDVRGQRTEMGRFRGGHKKIHVTMIGLVI